MNLENLREKIDKIDFEIIKLFSERFEIVKQVWDWKKQNWITNPLDSKRWEKVLEKNLENAKKFWVSEDFVKNIWEEIHKEALKIEK